VPKRQRFANGDRAYWIAYLDRTAHRDLRAFAGRWLTSTTSPS
jgi:hypothetical protein